MTNSYLWSESVFDGFAVSRGIQVQSHLFGSALRTCVRMACLLLLSCAAFPENAHAGGGPESDGLVPKVQSLVERFVNQFAYLRYEEDLVQEKLKSNQRVDYSRKTVCAE